jgi:hypothetical protein
MPAPDVAYFLDCSVQCGHMGGDTYHYFMNVCPDTNEILDNYDKLERPPGERHMHTLLDMGLYHEDLYLNWRHHNRQDSVIASFNGMRPVSYTIKELGLTAVNELYSLGKENLDRPGMEHLQAKYKFETCIALQRRSIARSHADMSQLSTTEIRAIRLDSDARERQQMIAAQEARNQYINPNALPALPDEEWNDGRWTPTPKLTGPELVRAQRLLQDKNRRVVKRSIKFFEKLVGSTTARLLISGDRIRIEGKHGVYEIKKSGTLTAAHGAARLSVFTKKNDLHLCDVCIYTPNVPMLDHVAAMIMDIQCGNEEQILSIGNPYNVSVHAREQDWLVPFLPKQTLGVNGIIFADHITAGMITGNQMLAYGPRELEDPKAIAERVRIQTLLRKSVSKYLYNELIDDFADSYRKVMAYAEPY